MGWGKLGGIVGGVLNPVGLLGTGIAAAGAIGDYASAQQQNRSQETIAKDANAFSASQAQGQQDFQERMSNTAHQREVADLKSAGLNPLLSLNNGASSPSGAAAVGQQHSVVPEVSAFTNSARDSLRLYSDWMNASANRDSARATAEASRASAKKMGAETNIIHSNQPERQLNGKVYQLFNSLFDRFKQTSAKQGWFSEKGSKKWQGDDAYRNDAKHMNDFQLNWNTNRR